MITEPTTSSGQLAVGTTVVCAAPCLLYAASITQSSAACSITLYDNATAGSGTVVLGLGQGVNSQSNTFVPAAPIYCKNGLTAVVAGTGATAYVFYYKEG
jgi:hypothetical protein